MDSLPLLPLPALTRLINDLASTTLLIQQHQDLLARLGPLLQAREAGNGRMELGVELGMGFAMEGIVEDTSTIHLRPLDTTANSQLITLPIAEAPAFVRANLATLESRKKGLDNALDKKKAEWESVKETLGKALDGAVGEEEIDEA